MLFIKDISFILEYSDLLLYAADRKLFKDINSYVDFMQLHEYLSRIINWCNINQLFLNFDKCFIMSYTRKLQPLYFNHSLTDDNLCNRVYHIKDLGIIFDATLSFMNHLNYLINKCNRLWVIIDIDSY